MNKSEYKLSLFIVWLLLGIWIMAEGNISRIQYGCVWICLVWELFDNWIESKVGK